MFKRGALVWRPRARHRRQDAGAVGRAQGQDPGREPALQGGIWKVVTVSPHVKNSDSFLCYNEKQIHWCSAVLKSNTAYGLTAFKYICDTHTSIVYSKISVFRNSLILCEARGPYVRNRVQDITRCSDFEGHGVKSTQQLVPHVCTQCRDFGVSFHKEQNVLCQQFVEHKFGV